MDVAGRCDQCGMPLDYSADPCKRKLQVQRKRFCPACKLARQRALDQRRHRLARGADVMGDTLTYRQLVRGALAYLADPDAEARVCQRHGTPDPAIVVYRNGPWSAECVAPMGRAM